VRREASLALKEGEGGWFSADHLFLDQDGVPTLVKVKRSSDTRIRREVIGQMLDYLANAVLHWPVDKIRLLFEERKAWIPTPPCRISYGTSNRPRNSGPG